MSIKYALKKIRAAKPASPKEFNNIGLPLKYIGEGAFRTVCKVVNCDLVVKFPLVNEEAFGRKHSVNEFSRIKRLKQSKVMQSHLPEVFYLDKARGIIVMRYYPTYESLEEQADAMGRLIQRLIYAHTRVRVSDIHTGNVNKRRVNHDGAVLIDLGY